MPDPLTNVFSPAEDKHPKEFENAPVIKGPDFNDPELNWDKIFDTYMNMGI